MMTKSIRTVLSPLLIISYISGLRIIEFPVGYSRIWFSLLYMLLFWSIYFFLFNSTVIYYLNSEHYTIIYQIGIGLDILMTLLSIVFGVYHDKKFRNCLKKLDIIDDTLRNVGTMTDYHKLYKKIVCLIIGWLLMSLILLYGEAHCMRNEFNYDVSISTYFSFVIVNYCFYINMINDLIIANIFGYIGLKFDQINQHLLDLTRDNKHEIKRVWENSILQHKYSQTLNNEWLIWIVLHLHLELRKISREIDSIFGTHMTFQIGSNFFWLTVNLCELFSMILINNYIKSNKILFTIIIIIWLCYNSWKLFIINHACEIVSTKANATGNLINKIFYFTSNIEVRENISQFLLQMTQTPVRFYGIGLFQYGYKFLYGFTSSITTVVVLLIQVCISMQTVKKNDD